MKKITDMLSSRLVIDPSIHHEDSLSEIVRQFKIDVISYKDNEEIILNLYYTLRTYFNSEVCDEVLRSSLTEAEIIKLDRDYKLEKLNIK